MQGRLLGFLVNPIAGMGGSVGLRGTDGSLAVEARARGALPSAGSRALRTLDALRGGSGQKLQVLTSAGTMGADAAAAAGFDPVIVHRAGTASTTAMDTRDAARALLRRGVHLLLFAGGDGTARDLLDVIGNRLPLLGIPSGVKMHSAVFAVTPRAAAEIVRTFFSAANPASLLSDAEIMDRQPDEGGELTSPSLYGFVRTPRVAHLVAAAKASPGDGALLVGAYRFTASLIKRDQKLSLLGPGSTLQKLKAELGVTGTLLGIDAVIGGQPVGTDLNEREILRLLELHDGRIVVGVVGGQGFLFGRGNQQLSAQVIRKVGSDNIIVIASPAKLAALAGGGLLVDTGDEALDEELAGYRPVTTGARRQTLVLVRSLADEAAAVRACPAGAAWP